MHSTKLARPLLLVGAVAGCLLLAAPAGASAQAGGEEPRSGTPPAGVAAAPAAPHGAGAECADCHGPLVSAFAANPHAHVRGRAGQGSCESCHTGAAQHAQTGDPAQVRGFKRLPAAEATAACQECHRQDRVQAFWKGSAHDAHDVGCTSCHAVHGGNPNLLARGNENTTCFTCHFDVRADLLKRSAHPLRDRTSASATGTMQCSSCHNPHGARTRALIDARSVNDKCYQCHAELRAPVLWEHSPVKEDCLICHTPHGSSNEKLLVSRVPRLCQDCHMQGRHQSGTLARNSVFAFNRSCLNCHPQVHGSNNPSGVVLQR
jgi:DmsE family decaheme c-type cytochrome